jgi:hypothetical protein
VTHSKKWFLWLAVLPFALVASLVTRFPLQSFLYSTLSHIVKPYPQLFERLLVSLVCAGVFVWAGAAIAPEHKSRAAAALFAVQMLLLAVVGVQRFEAAGGYRWWRHGAELVMAAAGSAIGYYIVRRKWGSLGTQPG